MGEFMDVLTSVTQRLGSFALSLQWWDVLDILVIAFLVYRLLLLRSEERRVGKECL